MAAAGRILRLAADPWVGFSTLVLVAWASLFAAASELARFSGMAALGPGMSGFAPITGALADLAVLCGQHAPSGLVTTIAMWCLMWVAMMAPTALPLLRTYRHMAAGSGGRIPRAGFHALLAGYLVVWALFSAGAGAAQHLLAAAGAVTDTGVSAAPWLTTGLLAAAGLYQFSALKHACLSRCRSPMAFFLSSWRPGARGALAMGLRHGADCVGCCWALMALAFVGGTMNLAWMGVAMVLMIVEKLPIGRRLTVPLGAVLIAAAGFVAASDPLLH